MDLSLLCNGINSCFISYMNFHLKVVSFKHVAHIFVFVFYFYLYALICLQQTMQHAQNLQTIHWCKSEEGRTSSNMSSIVADLNSTRILFLFYCDESINIIYCTTSLTKKKHNLLNKVLTSQETRGEDSQCGTGFGQPTTNQSTT